MIQERNECVEQVLRGKHAFVMGKTGSGKTEWMSYVCKNFLHCYVFVNPQLEESVDKVCDVIADTPEDVVKAFEEGYRKIEFIPPENDEEAIRDLEQIRKFLFDMGAQMNLEHGSFWCNFIIDEVQAYAWKGSRNDIDNLFRRGRRFGVRGWALSQRPQNVSSGIINNVDTQIIFITGDYERQYFSSYHIPIEAHAAHLSKPFHYLVYDGINVKECLPIAYNG